MYIILHAKMTRHCTWGIQNWALDTLFDCQFRCWASIRSESISETIAFRLDHTPFRHYENRFVMINHVKCWNLFSFSGVGFLVFLLDFLCFRTNVEPFSLASICRNRLLNTRFNRHRQTHAPFEWKSKIMAHGNSRSIACAQLDRVHAFLNRKGRANRTANERESIWQTRKSSIEQTIIVWIEF